MPSTRYSFSLNTQRDQELIAYLDSFVPRERTMLIRNVLLDHIAQQLEEEQNQKEYIETQYERDQRNEKLLNQILREIKSKQSTFTTQQNHDITNSDKEVDAEVLANLKNIGK